MSITKTKEKKHRPNKNQLNIMRRMTKWNSIGDFDQAMYIVSTMGTAMTGRNFWLHEKDKATPNWSFFKGQVNNMSVECLLKHGYIEEAVELRKAQWEDPNKPKYIQMNVYWKLSEHGKQSLCDYGDLR